MIGKRGGIFFFRVDRIEVRKRAIGRIRTYILQHGPVILEK